MSKSLSFSMIPEFKAYHDAHATLAKHGKTFNWARRFLGREASDRAARLYAFCRYLDDLADGGIHNGATHLETIRASFASLPEAAKWMMAAGMLLGRLELFSVLVLLVPSFWRE